MVEKIDPSRRRLLIIGGGATLAALSWSLYNIFKPKEWYCIEDRSTKCPKSKLLYSVREEKLPAIIKLEDKYRDLIYGEELDSLPEEYKSLFIEHQSDIKRKLEEEFEKAYNKTEKDKRLAFLNQADELYKKIIISSDKPYYIKTEEDRIYEIIPDLQQNESTWIMKTLHRDFLELLYYVGPIL